MDRQILRRTIRAAALVGTALTAFPAFAQDATWVGAGNNFNAGVNWNPAVVPTNRATFSTTGVTAISIAAPTTLNQFSFGAGAPGYSITNFSNLTLNGIAGIGIENLSSNIQTLTNTGTLTLNNASILGGTGGVTLANDGTSGSATLTHNGTSQFDSNSSLQALGGNAVANATTVIGGNAATNFNNTSGANGASLTQTGGTAVAVGIGGVAGVAIGGVASMSFNDDSHADDATFTLSAGSSVAVDAGGGATAISGVSLVGFDDASHADGAVFNSNDGGTTSVASFDGFVTTAIGGTSAIQFDGTSHADNAEFNNTGLGVVSVGGTGRAGTPVGTGQSGSIAIGIGGAVILGFSGDSHASGSTITNVASAVTSVGGTGGAGDTGVGGGGGVAQAFGASVQLTVADNAHLDNATVDSSVQNTLAAGGHGGAGGATGNGGTGGASFAFGGNISITVDNSASVNGTVFNNTAGNAVAAGGTGGDGGSGAGDGGTGGDAVAFGGNTSLTFSGSANAGVGTVITNIGGDATATGGAGGTGGSVVGANGGTGGAASATGGTATVTFNNSSSAGSATITNTAGTAATTTGDGGNGNVGAGGNGGTADSVAGDANIVFNNSSTAGNATIQNNPGAPISAVGGASGTAGGGGGAPGSGGSGSAAPAQATITFNDTSTGGSAQIQNNTGRVTFNDTSVFGTGAGATTALITNLASGATDFNDSSSLGNGRIVNGDGASSSGGTSFSDSSTAGSGTITNTATGSTAFFDSSTAGSATINNAAGGSTLFANSSTGGSATINNSGTLTVVGSADLVGATVVNGSTGLVNVGVNGLRLGSLSGGGTVSLSANTLQVGYLDRNDLFSGVISGTGALVKRGTGTFTLTGTNIYSGGTTISAGTLRIGNGGTTGSVVGDIVDNANLAFNRSDIVTFANIISGTGTVNQIGPGTLIFTNTNTYTGGTTISGGTLQLGNGGTTGSVVGNILDNGNLAFNRSDNVNFANVISGTGSVNQIGPGILIFTNANTYTGGTTISGGVLQIGNAGTTGSITGNVVNNSFLVFNRTDDITFGGNISGTGQLTKLAPGTLTLTGTNTYSGITLISQGTLQIGNGGTTGSISGNILNNAALVFNRSDTITYGGVVSGTGTLTKLGAGTLALTGANTYTGATTVSAGTLRVNGSITSNTTVALGATLGGTGTIFGNVVNNGTIAPGNSIGTLTISGNFTNNATGTYAAEVVPSFGLTGTSDLISAGTATLNGGTVQVLPLGTPNFGVQTDYLILTTSGGRTGTFASVNEAALPSYLDASLLYTTNNVTLRLRRNATNFATTPGLSENQGNLAAVLDAAIVAGNPLVFSTYAPLYNALLLAPGQTIPNLNQVSGDALTAYPLVAAGAAERFSDRMALQGSDQKVTGQSASVWGSVSWAGENFHTDGNGPNVDAKGPEFQIGAEYHYADEGLVGVSFGHGKTDVDMDSRLAFGDVRTNSVGAYFRHGMNNFFVAGTLSYSWHNIDSERSLLNGGLATSDFDAKTWSASAEVGFKLPMGGYVIEPHLRGRWISTKTDSFTESGPLGVLSVDADTYTSGRVGVGLRVAARDKAQGVRPFGLIAYEHELSDDRAALTNQLAGLPAFRVFSAELGKNVGILRVGVTGQVGTVSFFAAAGGELRGHQDSKQITGGIKLTW